jgi:hypothetical protein
MQCLPAIPQVSLNLNLASISAGAYYIAEFCMHRKTSLNLSRPAIASGVFFNHATSPTLIRAC